VWIIQTFPTVVVGLYTRWLHRWALSLGWLVGMAAGTWMVWSQQFKPAFPLHLGDWTVPGYAAFYALLLNFAVGIVLTLLFRAVKVAEGHDLTTAADYEHDVA
jgi:SSS family solute:Na+ symporter